MRDNKTYTIVQPLLAPVLLMAATLLSGCGSSANVAAATQDNSNNTGGGAAGGGSPTYLQSSSPSSGTYSNIPTSIILTFSAPLSSSALSTSHWQFYCGTPMSIAGVSGSGTIYTISVPTITPSSGMSCTLSSSGLTDTNGNSVSASASYTYNASSPSTGGGSNTPAYTFNFSNQGPTGTYTANNIDTDNLLQVSVTLGQPTTIPGTGYTAEYSCAQFLVTVLGQSQTVFLSNTGSPGYGYCNGAQVSQMVDFSSRLTSGHGPVTVTIENVSYDNCRLYGDVYGVGCPMTSVYSTHILTGALSIVVNTH